MHVNNKKYFWDQLLHSFLGVVRITFITYTVLQLKKCTSVASAAQCITDNSQMFILAGCFRPVRKLVDIHGIVNDYLDWFINRRCKAALHR